MSSDRFIFYAHLAAVSTVAMLGGCMNLSGLDGKSEFTCGAPNGVSCMSISGVSANVDRNNLPSSIKEREQEELTRDINSGESSKSSENKKTDSKDGASIPSYGATPTLSPTTMLTLGSGTPIRVPPKEMRIWMAPSEDSDGDLNEQRYIYVVVNDGRWMVDAARLNTRNKYTRFQPLVSQTNEVTAPASKERSSPQRDIRSVQPQPQPQPAP